MSILYLQYDKCNFLYGKYLYILYKNGFFFAFRCQKSEILFQPGRVVLQDFTGVAALVDLASMRDVIASKTSSSEDSDPSIVDSKCPADLVVDHAVQVDYR